MSRRSAACCALSLLPLFSCGYHISGHTDVLPKKIKTIAVPAFANVTTRYKLTDQLPRDIGREFLSRTRYRVVADPNDADAILTGTVVSMMAYPTIFDPATGRAAGVLVSVSLQISLTDRATGTVVFTRPSLEFRERYEISIDPKAYFDESGAAMERLSRDVARSVVSAVLENF